MNKQKTYERVWIPVKEGFKLVDPCDIVYVESIGKYCRVYYFDQKVADIVSLSIHEMAELFPKDLLFKVHRSYIISMSYIRSINKTKTRVYLLSDSPIPISQSHQEEFLKRTNFIPSGAS